MTHWFWWLLGTVGLGGTILIVVGFVVGWPVIVGTRLGRWMLALTTLGISVLVFYAKAVDEGRRREREAEEKRDEDFIKKHEADERDLDTRSDDELDRMLGKHGQP